MATNLPRALAQAKQNLKGTKHTGIVVDNTDTGTPPQQRIKVRVRDVHSGLMDADLPLAAKAHRGQYAASGIGEVDVPPIGATVSVIFRTNDLYHSEWSYAPSGSNIGAESQLPDYPESRGRYDYAGYKIWVNQKEGSESLNITATDGTEIHIVKGAKATIILPSGLDVQVHGDTTWECSGNMKFSAANITLAASQAATIAAPSVILSGSDSSFSIGSTLDFEGQSCNINAQNIRLAGSSIVLDANTVQSHAYTTLAAFPTNDNGDIEPTGGISSGPGGNPVPIVTPDPVGSLTTYPRPTIAFTPNNVDY